jgi:glycosyltransferase involved in cell wall biosynthesis
MSSCDLFINPLIDSVYDLARGPEKAGAYFAIGRPVIISDIGNLDAKIVDKFKLGYSVDNSTNDIYDKIQSLFLDEDLAISFEENCKKYARNNSWIKIAKKLEKIYFNLLQKSS